MTQEGKELLLKDLCTRLPYYTELYTNFSNDNWAVLTPVIISHLISADEDMVIKPYLRPMSSMTEEEENAYQQLCDVYMNSRGDKHYFNNVRTIDWFNQKHFDYRGLIKKKLAIDCTGMHIYD